MTPAAILPGAIIGIVGGGQLGRMLALEARRMGYRAAVLDPAPCGPAAQVADDHLRAALDDGEALRRLAQRADVITFEWENADPASLREIAGEVPLRPAPEVLALTRDRVLEKDAVRRLGVDTAEYRPVGSRRELDEALRTIGTPAILKTTRGGYDGRGQARIATPAAANAAWNAVNDLADGWILEAWVPFRCEVSVVCARAPAGETACFPAAENRHVTGILDVSIAPAALAPPVAEEAGRIAVALTEGLDLVGVLGVEMFVTSEERLLVNELAPRPHNSGHYTWEACAVSQFEQQLRAVCALPLGSPRLLRPAAMANLLGRHLPASPELWPGAFGQPETTLHLYGKREARANRKMGHLTALGETREEATERVLEARRRLRGT